ncbi:hypothetical protein ACFLTH_03305 [Bacteroidota bacterium]
MKLISILPSFVFLIIISSCTTLTLKPVSYAWPIESVLITDNNGNLEDQRYSLKISARKLIFEEFGNNTDLDSVEVRIIRNDAGYYFLTAQKFKNVYVFRESEASLKMENKILVSETGLLSPVMNQRSPFIELLDGNVRYMLKHNGVEGK